MDLHPDMQPTFIGVSCLPAIEMEVVLTVVNQAGAEHGWRPGLLLVQGWPLFCTKAALRSVTEMNAKPNRKRSSIVLLSGLTLHDLEGARGAAEAVGAEARQLFLGDSTAMLLTGLSAETMGTLSPLLALLVPTS